MTYNEWRDELKSNLLCVTEAERRRVLDYYAEAYADRRDAGFTEREIIDEFGAPYDAAQKILYENADDGRRDADFNAPPVGEKRKKQNRREQNDPFADDTSDYGNPPYNNPPRYDNSRQYSPPPSPAPRSADYTCVFVILCIIFAAPIFGVFMTLVGVTIGLVAAPFGIMVGGVATVGAGIGMLFSDPLSGAATLGTGLMIFGASLVLMPLCFKIVKFMWSLTKKFFLWVKSLFDGRRQRL